MPDLQTLFLPLGRSAFRYATGLSALVLAGAAIRASLKRSGRDSGHP